MYWPRCHSLNLNGPVPTGRALAGLVRKSRAFIEMLRHHRQVARHERAEERAERLLHLEDDGGRIRRLDVGDIGQHRARARIDLRQEDLGGEHDVGRGERLAVMPFHVLLELERVGQAVGGHRPRLGERRLRLEVEIVGEQRLVDLAADELDRPLLVDAEHQGRRLRLDQDVQGAAALLRVRRRPRRAPPHQPAEPRVETFSSPPPLTHRAAQTV